MAVRPASSSTTAGLLSGTSLPPDTLSTRLRSGTRARKYIPRMRAVPTMGSARYSAPAAVSIPFRQLTARVLRALPTASIWTTRSSERMVTALSLDVGATLESTG